jgi:2-polyprenyl-3-methyl-5-hydroxy-6-metoxy-1,4-benzoquinol methylase
MSRSSRRAAVAAQPDAFVCRNCGSERSLVRYTFAEHDTVIRECAKCRLMVLDPMPSEEDLHQVYNAGYFENEQLARGDPSHVYGYVDYISERLHKQKGYRGICEHLKQLVHTRRHRAKLLDYGCGLGFFLDAAYEFGFDVEGLEFNRDAIDYIKKRYRYEAYHPSEFRPSEPYDVVTMFDVIEHLREPFEKIAEVRRMLSEDGVIVILTADATSLVSRMMGKRLEDFRRIKEHLFFFDRANLSSILEKQGFQVLKVASIGHSFELKFLAPRVRAVLPLVGAPMEWFLRIAPFAGRWSVYIDPRTKFIVYARKRAS